MTSSNPLLLKLQKLITHFFTYFKSDDILAISDTKDSPPFAFVIIDDEYKHHILLSLAVDYPYPDKAAEVALWCSKVKATALTDSFYVAKNGITYVGNDAHKYYELDVDVPLEAIDPISKTQH